MAQVFATQRFEHVLGGRVFTVACLIKIFQESEKSCGTENLILNLYFRRELCEVLVKHVIT